MKRRRSQNLCHIEGNDLSEHLHHVSEIIIIDNRAAAEAIQHWLTSGIYLI